MHVHYTDSSTGVRFTKPVILVQHSQHTASEVFLWHFTDVIQFCRLTNYIQYICIKCVVQWAGQWTVRRCCRDYLRGDVGSNPAALSTWSRLWVVVALMCFHAASESLHSCIFTCGCVQAVVVEFLPQSSGHFLIRKHFSSIGHALIRQVGYWLYQSVCRWALSVITL